MEDMEMSGTPWFMGPVQLHAYREYECTQNTTAECEYYQQGWHFWYIADWKFALPTVGLFTGVIFLFALARIFDLVAPPQFSKTSRFRRITLLGRFLGYRTYRLKAIDWNSAPLGVLLLGLLGVTFFLFMTFIPQPYYWPDSPTLNYWGSSPPLATRAGWLSLGCMPFVFLTAGKSNFITLATGVPHERLQVFHRWISYAFFITALLHTFPFIVYNIKTGQMRMQWDTNMCYWTGVIAIVAQGWLTFASIGPLRNISYEFFKFTHFLAALVFTLFLFFHCGYTLSSWDYFIVTGVFFSLSFLHRQARIYFEHGFHHASVSMAANGLICVHTPSKARWSVGQHFFVRFMTPGLDAATTHPFTACSLPTYDSETSELVFYIRSRGGFTARLARHATAEPEKKVRILIDGPYGGVPMRHLHASKHQLVIAGGSGAGWTLPLVLALVRQNELVQKPNESVEKKLMQIVLATRERSTCDWFQRTLARMLLDNGHDGLPSYIEVVVYLTGSAADGASHGLDARTAEQKDAIIINRSATNDSDSSSLSNMNFSIRSGRPDLPATVKAASEMYVRGEQVGVYVCGPLSMQNDVANAAADVQLSALTKGKANLVLHMEHFSWA